ncbi:MAG: hypothetical protein GXX08_08205 [Firmicutes bacterium]|nr:hypothetical protein [Bacillota bacterium]
MNVLGLEASTSSAKALVYSTGSGVLCSRSMPYGKSTGDVVSLDPEGMYEPVVECARLAIQAAGVPIDAIGLCGIWHSLLLLDRNRSPLGRMMTWADRLAADCVNVHRQDQQLRDWLYQRSGCYVHSMYPLWKWKCMRERMAPGLEDARYISSQPEYLFERMTGESAVSQNVASGTGLMNIHTLDWDDSILEFAELRRESLSPIWASEHLGRLSEEAARRIGIPAGTPVVIAGADGALTQIGSGALKSGSMTISVGTSAALRVAFQKPVLPENPSTWCYYTAEGKWLAGAATSGAGNCVEWLRQSMCRGVPDLESLNVLTDEVDVRNAPIFLPFLYGERCPGWHDNRRGGFFGLTLSHSLGDLYYAILEGVLFNLYQCYLKLLSVGCEPERIYVSGGIIRSPKWLQMLADIFQREILVSSISDASTMGAIALAAKAMGEISSLEQFPAEVDRTVTPDSGKASLYQERFGEYMEWYEKMSVLGA